MDHNIISLFRIPGYRVVDVQIAGEEIIISVRKRSKTARCPCCRRRTKRLKDYLRVSKILHMTLCNQRVYLQMRKRRFYCLSCHTSFTEVISFLPRFSRSTIYAQQHALERLSDTSFSATSNRLKLSYSTLVQLLKRVFTLTTINWLEQTVSGVIRLGIDEHHFGKRNKYLVTIANLLTGKPIHILPNDQKKTLVAFLKQLPQEVADSIDEVAVDMKKTFIKAVGEVLPKAQIVIDHFHLIQDANRRVGEARRIEQDVQEKVKGNYPKEINARLLSRNREDLKSKQVNLVDAYLKRYPGVLIFYVCKEKLREMYRSGSREEAEEKLTNLIRFMKQSEYPELWIWAKTLKSYSEYILNYFDNHTTNAITEGLHRKFKLIQRTAYGFRNPEVYARRILLACLPLSILKLPHLLT